MTTPLPTDEQLQIWAARKDGRKNLPFYEEGLGWLTVEDGTDLSCQWLTSHDAAIALVRKVCQKKKQRNAFVRESQIIDGMGTRDEWFFDMMINMTPHQITLALYMACEGE